MEIPCLKAQVFAVPWYHSSEKVRLGFCSICGSSLFWEPIFKDWTAIAMGAFDTPTATKLARHILLANRGDYCEIADGLPQNQQLSIAPLVGLAFR